jgi:hypothetical protein
MKATKANEKEARSDCFEALFNVSGVQQDEAIVFIYTIENER